MAGHRPSLAPGAGKHVYLFPYLFTLLDKLENNLYAIGDLNTVS